MHKLAIIKRLEAMEAEINSFKKIWRSHEHINNHGSSSSASKGIRICLPKWTLYKHTRFKFSFSLSPSVPIFKLHLADWNHDKRSSPLDKRESWLLDGDNMLIMFKKLKLQLSWGIKITLTFSFLPDSVLVSFMILRSCWLEIA